LLAKDGQVKIAWSNFFGA